MGGGKGAATTYVGKGSEEQLLASFLDDGQFVLLAIRADGTIVYCTHAATDLFGHLPVDLLGTNVFELLHPDDAERALLALATTEGIGLVTGTSRFRVKRADGTYLATEIFGIPVNDGIEDLIGVLARSSMHEVVPEEILDQLLKNLPRATVLTPVCNVIQWHGAGSHLAICWQEEDGFHQVSTGLAEGLGGGDGRDGTPWSMLRRTGTPDGVTGVAADLPDDLQAQAREAGLAEFWIEPVLWSDTMAPATITIWTTGGTRPPRLHAYGMSIAKNMVELILRFTEHVADISRAATVDPLTGLLNRRGFSAALARESSGSLLYCDLDGFKPVNDTYGHTAGDVLLRLVALRMEKCVRDPDVVGRLGGDEFAVLCANSGVEEALAVAHRIRDSLAEPFEVEGQIITISVSIGVASSDRALDSTVLHAADQALFRAKEAGRSTVRVFDPVETGRRS